MATEADINEAYNHMDELFRLNCGEYADCSTARFRPRVRNKDHGRRRAVPANKAKESLSLRRWNGMAQQNNIEIGGDEGQ